LLSFGMMLTHLRKRQLARIESIEHRGGNDPIARRLGELGFVPGEAVQVLAHGPFGREPLLVQVGFTRFALRASEAERIRVSHAEEGA
jgi:ferrous iron transport protein A